MMCRMSFCLWVLMEVGFLGVNEGFCLCKNDVFVCLEMRKVGKKREPCGFLNGGGKRF